MSTRGAWLGVALMAGVAYVLITTPGQSATVKPHPFIPQVKQVTVDGRTYNVAALGGGNFSVSDAALPTTIFVFNIDTGPTVRTGDTSAIERDLRKFPKDLFTA